MNDISHNTCRFGMIRAPVFWPPRRGPYIRPILGPPFKLHNTRDMGPMLVTWEPIPEVFTNDLVS